MSTQVSMPSAGCWSPSVASLGQVVTHERELPDPSYPAHWEADVVLRDGGTAHVRPITLADADRLRAFHEGLSPETIYYRFFAPYPHLSDKDVERFTNVDHHNRAALVATIGDDIIGVVRYEGLGDKEAEVAFVIRDDQQARGLGSVFLEHIAEAARENGFTRFVADVLPNNTKMLGVFQQAGYQQQSTFDEGVVRLEFPIQPTEQTLSVMQAREHRAESVSTKRLLAPTSVVVVGASRDPDSVGQTVLRDLVDSGFKGRRFAVNTSADGDVLGVPTFESVTALPQQVDLAVVCVPALAVLDVVTQCAVNGVRGLVVVSGGFAETGPWGRERQRELVQRARANGMRVIGPNCLGVINTDPDVLLNASLSPVMPGRGRIGFFSQSGALGIALLKTLVQRGLGLSTFVSAGNRADVSGNDLMQYWEDDPATDLVLLYLESLGNPRKFTRIARRLGRSKPVVAVKSGRSSQGIPLGHTVRGTALPPEAVDEMFDQCGVIQVDTLSQLFDVAQMLTFQPLPEGRRVAVVGNSDALGVLAADSSAALGLTMIGEPLIVRPDASTADFAASLVALVEDPAVDSVVVLYVPPVGATGEDVARALAKVAARATKPVVATLLAVEGVAPLLRRLSPDGVPVIGSVPTYSSVEDAVRALAAVTDYAEWRRRTQGKHVELEGIDSAAARTIVEEALEASPDGGPLTSDEVTQLLGCYGVELWPWVRVSTEEEAVEAARAFGFPVVLKSTAPYLRNRTDLGGVRLNLFTEAAIRAAYSSMTEQFGEDAELVVQKMAPLGVACVITTTEDALFGPVVSFGMAGVTSELVGDRGYRIPPLTDVDSAELVRSPKASALLFGYRGADPADADAVEELLLRVSRMADELPELARLELEPVVVATKGLAVLGASARVARPVARTDTPVRRLPA